MDDKLLITVELLVLKTKLQLCNVCMYVCVCVVETRRGQGSLALVFLPNHKDTSCSACTQNRSFDPGPCYCQWLFQPSGGSAIWPKFNACK